MMNLDNEDLYESYRSQDDNTSMRPKQGKFRVRRRPEYCKKRTPIRRSANLRSNFRKVR